MTPMWLAVKLAGAAVAAAIAWYVLDGVGWKLDLDRDVKKDFKEWRYRDV